MPNLRILAENVWDDGSIYDANDGGSPYAVGDYAASNLKSDIKSKVWRQKHVTLIPSTGMSVVGNTASRTTPASAWDQGVRSAEGLTGGAYVRFKVAANTYVAGTSGFMVALSVNPSIDNDYPNLNYAIWINNNNGLAHAYESNVDRGALTTWVVGDVFEILYNHAAGTLGYFKNGASIRTVSVTISSALYLDSSFDTPGAKASEIYFWPNSDFNSVLVSNLPAQKEVNCIILPFTNLTKNAKIRLYLVDHPGGSVVLDTGFIDACPADPAALRGFTAAQALSAYAYGGGSCVAVYFNTVLTASIVIVIEDKTNPQGYVEVSRVLAGKYWSPKYNSEFGASFSLEDTSKSSRAESGDLITDRGIISKSLKLPLGLLEPSDRTSLINILRYSGTSSPLFVSLHPEDSDKELERDHQVYGKLSNLSATTLFDYKLYSSSIEIEQI